jgi:hypothetical protein
MKFSLPDSPHISSIWLWNFFLDIKRFCNLDPTHIITLPYESELMENRARASINPKMNMKGRLGSLSLYCSVPTYLHPKLLNSYITRENNLLIISPEPTARNKL